MTETHYNEGTHWTRLLDPAKALNIYRGKLVEGQMILAQQLGGLSIIKRTLEDRTGLGTLIATIVIT